MEFYFDDFFLFFLLLSNCNTRKEEYKINKYLFFNVRNFYNYFIGNLF